MTRVIDRLKLVFLGIFALACAGVWAYQLMVVAPAQRCEAAGNWWDPQAHICGIVVDVRTFPRFAGAPHHADTAGAPATAAAPVAAVPSPQTSAPAR